MLLIMMAKDAIPRIRQIILDLCKDKDWNWKGHIESVVKYSKILAKKTGADEDIAEIAAWLHDITRMTGDPENHHISSPIEAEMILRELHYPQDKIDKVKHCINAHRGSKAIKRETIEAECVASADALSHFDNFNDLAYWTYKKGLSAEEGRDVIMRKYERCWKKMMPEARKMAKKRYDAIRLLLEK
ncbi:MAG: HD domain-containing protein [Candidatus Woesearchaeota archaeon]|nr:HD domain-containing protein [Candidatus Woesearchaeota archaeon]